MRPFQPAMARCAKEHPARVPRAHEFTEAIRLQPGRSFDLVHLHLTRARSFFFLASLTLALGIGIATLMFSVTESVLWRPLPLPDPERLVLLSEYNPKTHPNDASASAANYLDWRSGSHSFERFAAISWSGRSHTLTGSGERVRSLAISSSLFATLGVKPALGRTFSHQEESAGSQVAILSHEFWRTHFDASAEAVGRTFQLDRQTYTVAGVLPRVFISKISWIFPIRSYSFRSISPVPRRAATIASWRPSRG